MKNKQSRRISMTEPIQDLLNRIRWDPGFGFARFVVGYYDRVSNTIVHIPFERIRFKPDDHFYFEVDTEDGAVHDIPLHRVREVYRDGELIWHRKP
ncbi:MAG: DUF504 domain-containing protein [Gammaproteobacteria bacterium]